MTRFSLFRTRKSRVAVVMWVLTLSWWNSKPWLSRRGRRLHHSSKTLGRQMSDIPIRVDSLPLLERYGGNMARFREEAPWRRALKMLELTLKASISPYPSQCVRVSWTGGWRGWPSTSTLREDSSGNWTSLPVSFVRKPRVRTHWISYQ